MLVVYGYENHRNFRTTKIGGQGKFQRRYHWSLADEKVRRIDAQRLSKVELKS